MSSTTKIIAEIAQGYEGKPDYCAAYVKAAAKSKVDAVKFQIVYADDVAEPGYQYYDFYRTLEMDVAVWQKTRAAAKDAGVAFFCDVSGYRALDVAQQIAPDGIKIHSSNFFNRALIGKAKALAPTIFISIGGAKIEEIDVLVDLFRRSGDVGKLVLLYGFQSEPTPTERSGLGRLPMLIDRYRDVKIGYLDHTEGGKEDTVTVSAMAMALGASWIEKHLTLDRHLEVEDYVSGLEPAEFSAYVSSIRRLASALGGADFALSDLELGYRDKSVKKLVSARALPAGHKIELSDIVFKRTPRIPAFKGFHDPSLIVDRRLRNPLAAGDPILEEILT